MNSRSLALESLIEWEHSGEFAHDIIEKKAAKNQLSARDSRLLLALVFGVLRHVNLLDHWIERLSDSRHLETRVEWLLRLGLAQVLILDMPVHAAVNETVALGEKARGLVNAILRRAIREKDALLVKRETLPTAIRYSHPDWLVSRWERQFGAANTAALCAWDQEPAPVYIRINRLHPNPPDPADYPDWVATSVPDFYRVDETPRELLAEGRCYAQDPSTALACRALDPKPGQLVLDACAAPGGKTSLLAQMMQGQGQIVACDSSSVRLERLRGNLARLHAAAMTTPVQFDWTGSQPPPWNRGSFDAILVDAPCSNTGVMRRRVDVRWRLDETVFKEMAALQRRIIAVALPLLKRGGKLVYSTCSLDAEENEQVVASVLRDFSKHTVLHSHTSAPFEHGMDGAFVSIIGSSQT